MSILCKSSLNGYFYTADSNHFVPPHAYRWVNWALFFCKFISNIEVSFVFYGGFVPHQSIPQTYSCLDPGVN